MRSRRLVFLLLLGGALLAGCRGEVPAGEEPVPEVRSVVMISIDALRPDYLGCYGSPRGVSPNLDRLAEQGIVFNDVLAPASSTAISHKSILYGVHPAIHRTTVATVPSESLTSPLEALRQAGMETAAFVGGGQLNPKYGFNRGFDTYRAMRSIDQRRPGEGNLELLERLSFEWLDEHAGEDFFLLLHTYEVHCPYAPPEPFRGRHAGWYEGDVVPEGNCGENYYNHRELDEEDLRFLQDLYAAGVEYVDAFLGRLFDRLEQLGLDDETMIVFLADHGESLGEQGYVGHNRMYESNLRIPLVMRLPGIPPSEVDLPVEAVDIMPTILAALGVEPPYPFQGRSLLPAIRGGRPWSEERIRIVQQENFVAVRQGDWKHVFNLKTTGRGRLHDLAEDPSEKRNVGGEEPGVMKRLRGHYEETMAAGDELASQFVLEGETDPTLDEELRRELEALGYIE